MLAIALLLSLECLDFSSTIMRRMSGSRSRRLALAVAKSVAKWPCMLPFSKRRIPRYIVRSGAPVSLVR